MLDKLAKEFFPNGLTEPGIKLLEQELTQNQVDPASVKEMTDVLRKQLQNQMSTRSEQSTQSEQPTNTTQTSMQTGLQMNRISGKDIDIATQVFEFIDKILTEPKKVTANSHQVTPDMLCVEFSMERDDAHKALKVYSIAMAKNGKGKDWAIQKISAFDFSKFDWQKETAPSADNPFKGDVVNEKAWELGTYKAKYNEVLDQLDAANQEIAGLREQVSRLTEELGGNNEHEIEYE